MIFKSRWLHLVVYMSLLILGSIGPALPSDGKFAGISIDKFYHAIAYAILGILVSKTVETDMTTKKNRKPITIIFFATLTCIIFGAVIELLQILTPPRTASLLDIIANGIGGVTGAIIFTAFTKFRAEKTTG